MELTHFVKLLELVSNGWYEIWYH